MNVKVKKVEENPTVPQRLKDICNGNNKWKLKHLSDDTVIQTLFMERVAPLTHLKAATLDPWSNLNIDKVQVIIDHVYGASRFEVKEDGPWLELVCIMVQLDQYIQLLIQVNACLQDW